MRCDGGERDGGGAVDDDVCSAVGGLDDDRRFVYGDGLTRRHGGGVANDKVTPGGLFANDDRCRVI